MQCPSRWERTMAATSVSSSPPRVAAKVGLPKSSSAYTQLTCRSRHPFQKHAPELLKLSSPAARNKQHARTIICPATDNNQVAPAAEQETAATPGSDAAEEGGATATPSNGKPPQQQQPDANGSAPSEPPKRAPLTARERLRAARVLGKYAEPSSAKGSASSKPGGGGAAKPEFGSGVLDALREADAKKAGGGGGRRRSRLPEAPGNLFDDSKRGLPKDGWTFELPFGVDVFLVLVSFTLITSVMLGTAYLVWKLGAIHFNEY